MLLGGRVEGRWERLGFVDGLLVLEVDKTVTHGISSTVPPWGTVLYTPKTVTDKIANLDSTYMLGKFLFRKYDVTTRVAISGKGVR